jgi:hypothetical protein
MRDFDRFIVDDDQSLGNRTLITTGLLAKSLAGNSMKRFSVGQKWITDAALCDRFFGEVIEASAQGLRGTVVITDEQGNVLDTPTAGVLRGSTLLASGD